MAIRSIAGGLLTGIGTGLISDAEAKREAALQALREKYRQEEKADDRNFRREETDFAYRRQLARDADSHDRNLERDDKRHTQRRGLLREKESGEDGSGLSASDQRALNAAQLRHTSGKGSLEGEVTDWDAVAKRLRTTGREDLAAYVESMEGEESGVNVESADYLEAQSMARDWAKGRAGLFRTDKTDFADWDGNRAEAIQQKTMEYYQQLTGKKAPPSGQPDSEPRQAPAARQEPQKAPPGDGTEASPFRATLQSEIDWFKQNAPAGAVIEVNGQLFQKE